MYLNIVEVLDIQDQFAYYHVSIMCQITQLHEPCSHWPQEILQYHPEKRAKTLLLNMGNRGIASQQCKSKTKSDAPTASSPGEDRAVRVLPCSLHAHISSPCSRKLSQLQTRPFSKQNMFQCQREARSRGMPFTKA